MTLKKVGSPKIKRSWIYALRVMDPCFKGHGDSRQVLIPFLGCIQTSSFSGAHGEVVLPAEHRLPARRSVVSLEVESDCASAVPWLVLRIGGFEWDSHG